MNEQDLRDGLERHSKWRIEKFWEGNQKEPFEVVEWEGNLGLDAGLDEAWDLICSTGTPQAYNNVEAHLFVGTSTTAASSTQTGILAGGVAKGMLSTYPTTASQDAVFKSSFASAEANIAWQEFVLDNSSAESKALVRKVSNQGTKTAGQVKLGPLPWQQGQRNYLWITGTPERVTRGKGQAICLLGINPELAAETKRGGSRLFICGMMR